MKNKNKKRNLYPICYIFFWNFQPLLILLLTDIDHTLWLGWNASLLVLKDLQPSNSEKTNRPSLGILQKEIRATYFPKELVHEHLALFIYLRTYLCLGDHEHVPGPDSCESLPSS